LLSGGLRDAATTGYYLTAFQAESTRYRARFCTGLRLRIYQNEPVLNSEEDQLQLWLVYVVPKLSIEQLETGKTVRSICGISGGRARLSTTVEAQNAARLQDERSVSIVIDNYLPSVLFCLCWADHALRHEKYLLAP
jgi:hypothetical protein